MSSDPRMNKIQWRRSGPDKKYFSYFDTKEEAWEYLEGLARRYKHSPYRQTSILSLCEESQEKGIMIYPYYLGRWFDKVFGINVTYPKSRPKYNSRTHIIFSEEVHKRLKPLTGKKLMSRFVDRIIAANIRLPVDDLFIIMDEITIWMYMEGEEARAVHLSPISKYEHQLVESFCIDAEEEDLRYVREKAERLGFKCLGATTTD